MHAESLITRARLAMIEVLKNQKSASRAARHAPEHPLGVPPVSTPPAPGDQDIARATPRAKARRPGRSRSPKGALLRRLAGLYGVRSFVVTQCKMKATTCRTCVDAPRKGRVKCECCDGTGERVCRLCAGDGIAERDALRVARCLRCQGRGRRRCPRCVRGWMDCPTWGGNGLVIAEGQTAARDGRGRRRRRAPVAASMPASNLLLHRPWETSS
jgi:hypothetical protein